MQRKVSDVVASFFQRKGVRHGFGIIGSANSHLFDSIVHRSDVELICNHHEQACVMAAQTYWKITETPSFALVTAGAGSSNAITGVLSAWADSVPCLIISGQENSRYIPPKQTLRMYGIQGYDSPAVVEKMTKYATRILNPNNILFELEKAWQIATTGRPGPCWLDIPMDVQAMTVEEESIPRFQSEIDLPATSYSPAETLSLKVKKVVENLSSASRPLLWLGVGVRMGNSVEKAISLVESLGIPVLISWSAIDMFPADHHLLVGRAGVYGQRAANLILQSCDSLVAIGTRLSLLQVGYDISEFARAATNVTVVDIDHNELDKYRDRFDSLICADAGAFIDEMQSQVKNAKIPNFNDWIKWCREIRNRFPVIGHEHKDTNGYINSYKFLSAIEKHLKPDQIVVTDMGTALLSGHQALKIQPPQRLLTSQGLGEMGFGLPGAIGASLARDRGEVLCLNCDGGMMMNLQELQTIVHYQLPIKLIIFNNDGYLMIKHTQKAILQSRYSGTNRETGVSCPDFSKLAAAFGVPAFQIRTWDDFEKNIPSFQNQHGPAICEVFMDPEQFFHPKLGVATASDGSLVSPPLEDLSPLLTREVLEECLKVPLHPKSKSISIK